MRNLKKFLALVLALMMVMSVMVTVSAKTSYADDEDIDAKYSEAIEVLTALGVLEGRGEGATSEFDPTGKLTRAEAAKIVAYMTLGSAAENLPTAAVYTDVPTTFWGNKYVNWASLNKVVDPGNEKFRPNDKVTGYEFGKMVLVAAGYDPDKYTNVGAAWTQNVAVDVANMTAAAKFTLKTGDLSSADIDRQAAAQLAFAGLNYGIGETYYKVFVDKNGDKVYDTGETVLYEGGSYSLALLHMQTAGAAINAYGDTLGSKTFGLSYNPDSKDDWGRPTRVWSATKPDVDVEFEIEPEAYYEEAISECDVVAEHSSLKDKTVTSYWVNGVEQKTITSVGTGGDAKIEALGVTEYIGDQGQETYIYTLPAGGYRVVEIDTYLAQVTGVTPSWNDPQGHPTTRTINLDVYNNANGTASTVTGFASTKYEVGDYVLVNINWSEADLEDGVSIVGPATVMAVGTVTTWQSAAMPNPGVTSMGTTKLTEAEHFYLGHQTIGSFAALSDGKGNVIGMTQATQNFAVVEAIVWNERGLFDGFASANLVLADGTRAENVTISAINGNKPSEILGSGTPASGTVADTVISNADYYNHVIAYSKNADGTYSISTTADPGNHTATKTAVIDSTQGLIYNNADGDNTYDGATEYLAATTENTVFLVKNVMTGKYDVIKGKTAMPSMTNCLVCVANDLNGYATLVVVDGTQAANVFAAMVLDPNRVGNNGTLDAYCVYKVGEDGATVVYSSPANWAPVVSRGLYVFTVNNQGVLQAPAVDVLDNATPADVQQHVIGNTYTVWGDVDAGYSGMTFRAAGNRVFNLQSTTKVYVVNRDANLNPTSIRTGVFTDIVAGRDIIAVYDVIGGRNYVSAVYVYVTAGAPAGKISAAKASITPRDNGSGTLYGTYDLTVVNTLATAASLTWTYKVEYFASATGWTEYTPATAGTAITVPAGTAAGTTSVTCAVPLYINSLPSGTYRATFTLTLPSGTTVTNVGTFTKAT